MAPVLVRINRRRCLLLGGVQGAVALLLVALLAFPLAVGIFDWLIAAGLATAAVFGWFALYFFGLAARNPVALRMDDHGISGFYTEPATWGDISSVAVVSDSRNSRYLGFVLADPEAFRARQGPWRRFKFWSSYKGAGAHILIPEMVLADADMEGLAATASGFLKPQKT